MQATAYKAVQWREGSRIKADPALAYEQVTALSDSLGRAPTAVELVENSKNKNTPLHNDFTWDDSIAGSRYREAEARRILGSFVTVHTSEKGKDEPVRIFHAVREVAPGKNRGYETLSALLMDADGKKKLLDEALRELRTFRHKYAVLKDCAELRGVFH